MSAATEPRLNSEPSFDVVPFEVARHENAIDHHPIDDIEPEASTGLDFGGGALEVCRLAVAMGADRFILLAARVCNPRASVRELGRIAGVGHSTAARHVKAIVEDYPQLERLFTSGKHNEGQRERRKSESARDNSAIGEGAMMPEIYNSLVTGDRSMTITDRQRSELAAKVEELQKLGLPIRKQRDGESLADYSQYVYGAEAEAVLGGRIEPVMASGKIKMQLAPRAQASKPVTAKVTPKAAPKPKPQNDRESIINSKRTIEGRTVQTMAGVTAEIGGVDVLRYQAKCPDPEQEIHDNGDLTPVLDVYNNLTDARLKTRFWNENRTAIQTELMLAASVKARLDDQLSRKQAELAGKQAAAKAKAEAVKRKQADQKVEALRKTLSSASKSQLATLKNELATMGV